VAVRLGAAGRRTGKRACDIAVRVPIKRVCEGRFVGVWKLVIGELVR
jgi:hypothetical protein